MTSDLTDRQIKQLMNDLNAARVAKRSQGGAQLSYLEAWDVRATLIRVFGFAKWNAEVLESQVIRLDEIPASNPQGKSQWRALASATVRLTIHQTGATYTEAAAQSQKGPDIGEVTDFAIKTAESDALKRAAMNLGTQFGLSLYDSGSVKDVVRVLLAPGQAEALDRIRNPQPEPAPDVPAPGEDPRDDLPRGIGAVDPKTGEWAPLPATLDGDFGDASHDQPEDQPMWRARTR